MARISKCDECGKESETDMPYVIEVKGQSNPTELCSWDCVGTFAFAQVDAYKASEEKRRLGDVE